MSRYSLKKALSDESSAPKQGLIEEGFWSDLALAVATGGPGAIQDIIQSKLANLLQKKDEMETGQVLDMVGRLKKLGLKKVWGHDLDQVEKHLTKKQKKGEDTVDTDKLSAALGIAENASPYKGAKLADIFLED